MDFNQKLLKISKKNNSLLCVGLDIDKEKMPDFLFKNHTEPYLEFNKAIIDSTKDLVCAYKFNMAFYEIFGKMGLDLLEKTIKIIPNNIIIILDGKRNDIGNSSKKYAQFLYEKLNADATTVNPFMGHDSILPFLEYENKCNFILCRTSNKSAVDFQDLKISKVPLYQIVAKKIKEWNIRKNCGAVVGATYPEELKIIRGILGENIPILIPGIGAQGGDIKKSIEFGTNSKKEMALVNSSRNIIFASKKHDFAEISRKNALKLRDTINSNR